MTIIKATPPNPPMTRVIMMLVVVVPMMKIMIIIVVDMVMITMPMVIDDRDRTTAFWLHRHLPFKHTAILPSAELHRCHAVVRPTPKRAQISFQGTPSARNQTRHVSSEPSQASHRSVSSMRSMAAAGGGPSRTRASSQPYASQKSRTTGGQVLK